jgi:hypothetical protein
VLEAGVFTVEFDFGHDEAGEVHADAAPGFAGEVALAEFGADCPLSPGITGNEESPATRNKGSVPVAIVSGRIPPEQIG